MPLTTILIHEVNGMILPLYSVIETMMPVLVFTDFEGGLKLISVGVPAILTGRKSAKHHSTCVRYLRLSQASLLLSSQ